MVLSFNVRLVRVCIIFSLSKLQRDGNAEKRKFRKKNISSTRYSVKTISLVLLLARPKFSTQTVLQRLQLCSSHHLVMKCALSCTNIIFSTLDGCNDDGLALTVKPAMEKTLSDAALVAGTAIMHLANAASLGNVSACCCHQISGSSVASERQRNCCISRSTDALITTCLASISNFVFFHGFLGRGRV